MLHADITEKIIECFYKVYNTLGYGFLERVYEKALIIELEDIGLKCEAQKQIKVYYHKQEIGLYFSDVIVENKVIVELKARALVEEDEYQLLNYLKATDKEVGLLLSFGKKPKFKRKIYTNDLK